MLILEPPPYLCVLLDEEATIVKIELRLEDVLYDEKWMIGKNWFELFIDPEYTEELKRVFKEVLAGSGSFITYENDIRCKDGTHRLIDFHNTVFQKDGKKFIRSVGLEHRHNVFGAMDRLIEKLGDIC